VKSIKASYQQKYKHCVIVCTTRNSTNSANLWVTMHSLQHKTHDELHTESMHFMIT